MSPTTRLSLVVPCYNEVEVVNRFHEALSRELSASGRPYEIVYVDDGSSDGTLDALVGLAAADESVRYLSFSRNFGKESAMLAGLRYATGDAVVIMDADLQHPPELIGRMLEEYERGFDQVIARRNRTGDPATRTFLARAYWGGAYNREMKRLMLAHAFQFVDRVIFIVGVDNIRSHKAMLKIGGVLTGRREMLDLPGGGSSESVIFEITKESRALLC